ncbi:MAG: hypothetical protein EXS60_00330 [Candidatus Pacebacteria bacterium]|nr:hypothetical protein [Candidatus Paceibacterota bacterium]
MKLSLWLVPPRGSLADKALRTTIERIVTVYGALAFPPHVTLIGGIEGDAADIKEKTAAIAARLTPYKIQLGNIESEIGYYRKLFLRVFQSKRAMESNLIAQKILRVEQGDYLPHCSLAYGDLVPSEITEIKETYIPNDLASKAGFTANLVQLWNTSKAVKDWRCIASFPFGKT